MANNFFKSPFDALIEDAQSFEAPAPAATPQPQQPKRPAQALRSQGLMPPDDLRGLFEEVSAEFGVPVNILSALAQQESSYNPLSVNKSSGAKGLFNYMDATSGALGINPFDTRQSTRAAAMQFRERLDKGESIQEAIAHHFAGPDRKLWGPKTEQYVKDVMAKAGTIGEGFMSRAPKAAPDFDLSAIQAELDGQEPGRFKVLSPEEAERYQKRGDLLQGQGQLQAAKDALKPGAPSPLTVENQQRVNGQPAPSPLTMDNQARVEAGLPPKDTRPYQSFTEATGAAVSNVPERFQQSIAGLIQLAGEDLNQERERFIADRARQYGISPGDMKLLAWAGNEGLIDPKTPIPEALQSVKQNIAQSLNAQQLKQLDAAGIINPAEITAFAKDWRKETQKTMAEVRPEPGSAAFYGSAAIGSLAEMAPMIAGAIVTRSPKVAMAIMGGQVGGQSYAEGREKGLSEDQAQTYALLTAAAEAAPEALVVGRLLKPGAGALKKVLEGTVMEGAQEAVTAALQAGIDQQMIDPNMTLKDALVQIRDSAIIGALTGGGMSTAFAGADALSNRRQQPGAAPSADPVQDGATPAAAPAATTPTTQAATTPAAEVPEPVAAAPVQASGPLGRAVQAAAQTGEERVSVQTPAGTVSGTLESYDQGADGSWSARVLGDDGQFYQYSNKDGVQVLREGQPMDLPTAEAPAAVEPAVDNPAVEGTVDAGQQADSAVERAIEEAPVDEAALEEPAQPMVINPVSTADEDRKPERSYADMGETELRAQLKHIAAQAKASGGWNKLLMAERKKVEQAISALANKPADTGIEVAAKPAETPVAQAPETGGEKPAPKWFGSQEKADAYIAKKQLADSHEVVPAGRNRFEIHEKANQSGESTEMVASTQAADDLTRALAMAEDDYIKAVNPTGERISEDDRVRLEAGDISVPKGAAEISTFQDNKGRTVRVLRADDGSMYAESNGTALGFVGPFEDGKTVVDVLDKEQGNGVGRGLMTAYIRANPLAQSGGFSEAGERTRRSVFRALQAEASGADLRGAPINDEWSAFATEAGSLNVPRAEMPQIKAEHRGAMVNFLNARGIAHQEETVPADSLKPTQAEFSPAKVAKAKGFEGGDRSILVSNDNHVLDGHHQWLAKRDNGEEVKVIRLDAPMRDLLPVVNEFPSASNDDGATAQPVTRSAPKAEQPTDFQDKGVMAEASREDNEAALRDLDKLVKAGTISQADAEAIVQRAMLAARKARDRAVAGDYIEEAVERLEGTYAKHGAGTASTIEQAESGRTVSAAEVGPLNIQALGKPTVSENKVFTEDAAEKARALLRSKLTQLNSGIDPEIMQAGITLAGYHIEKGARTFAAYSKAMLDDMGEMVRPYLKSWYLGVRFDPRAAGFDGMSSAAEVEAANIDEVESRDNQASQAEPGPGDTGDESGGVQADEPQREAGAVSGQPDGGLRGERGQRKTKPAEPVRDEGRPGQGGRSEQPDGGDRNDRAQPGSREDQHNYRIQPGELKRTGSWKATAEQNVRIVELVKQITAENRPATPDEKALLTKFTGWGASEIANGIFPNQYGQYKDGWRELGERLKAALTPEEYAQAKRTTQYAHYTSEPIIRSVYGALERIGFNGGQVLEPGMGIGLFNGLMPDGMVPHSTYTGIEYDSITGTIGKLLYPESNIVVGDFTQTKLPKDFFDAAIGNPPFGQIKIQSDPEYKRQGFLLHDYFFAKTIDRVKPGGVLVFVTSKGTMDKASDRARKYLAERADLLGAIRLPQTAFKDNAGTEVVTDVIFLRKRAPGQEPGGEAWAGLGEVQTPQGPAHVNEYFAAHPEMVLGKHAKTGSMYRADEYTVEPIEGDIEQLFAKAIENLPANVYRPERGSPAERAAVQRRDYDPKVKKEGGVYVADDGALMQVEDGQGVPLTSRLGSAGKEIALKPREAEWLKGYTRVRDALKQAQYDQLNEGPWEKSLKALNKAYTAFTKEHGDILAHSVTERTNEDGSVTVTRRFKNEPLIRLDAEGALAYALEVINTDGTISKGAVLNGRTLNKPSTPTIATTQDALFVSLNEVGRFDLGEIARLAGKSEAEVIADLGTAIYQDPSAGWTTADDYLSGNVVRKLKEAQAAARLSKAYERNVEALKNVQPRALAPIDITVQLGSAWVPASDVQNFAAEVMGEKLSVSYSSVTGQWTVNGHASSVSEWGTGDKKADDILEAVLNNRQLKVTYRDAEGKTHVDPEATEKVNDIAKKLRTEFKRWIWSDTARADRLAKFYNEHYNNIAPRQFDGSHLTLPGVSSRFSLRPHQKRAIWRTIQQGDTYYAHAVGAGKTFTMIAAGMEERRLGLSRKPMYVVPNHMLAQFSKEFLELYPTASIMVADEQNFHTHNRRKFVAQAALNDPDAIVITHSAFGRIGMSAEFTQRFIEGQIADWQAALEETDKADRVTRKQIERRIEQLENRLKATVDGKKDQLLSFEELGVDRLYVDEGHEFRKLDFPTNRGNIKGIDPSGSQRAMDLFMKVQYLQEKNPQRALVMASGTPITNTMGELFTVQRFFQGEQLEEDGDQTFDAWANHYGEVVDGLEQNAAGLYETVTRFAKFVNVPELMSRVRSFMDILTSEQLGDLVQRPDVEQGGRQVIVTPTPDGYKAYQKALEDRIKAIRNRKGPPKPGEDIILSVIADGRFSAIDMRFVDPSLPSDPNSKLNRTLDDMIEVYHATAGNQYQTGGQVDPLTGGSLMLFTDIGLGEQSAKSRGFDMKGWIEQRLLEGGVKPEHIAFMRDHKAHAKKERLFDDLRQGRKRILIGGKDMETGVNAQKRLAYLGHLDAPWFPASVEQREGRIIRQGNQNPRVTIKAYATKGSYDSTMWGMNARKARFIEQAMSGDSSVRSLDDVSEASAFEMAAALASGDERYLKLAGLKADTDRLGRLYSAHLDEQRRLRSEKMGAESNIKHNREKISELKEAIAKREPIKAGEFSGKVGKVAFDSRDEFSAALFNDFKALAEGFTAGEQTLGELAGFPIAYNGVELRGGNFMADATLSIPGDPDPLIAYPIDPDASVAGIATRAVNQVNGMDRQVTQREGFIAESQAKLEKIERRLGAAFPEQAELREKQEELTALEIELEAESKAANADAAAATVEVEGQPTDEVKFSLADDRLAAVRDSAPLGITTTRSLRGLPDAKLRERVFTELMSRRDRPLQHPVLGEIALTRDGIRKSRSNAADRAKLYTMQHLDEVVANGVDLGTSTDGGRTFRHLGTRLNIDGVPVLAMTTVQDVNGKPTYYNTTILQDVGGPAFEGARVVDNELGAFKRPILTPQITTDRASAVRQQEGVIREALANSPLGKAIEDAITAGKIVIHPRQPQLGTRAVVQGYTDDQGTIHLVAENLTAQNAPAVALHEAFHAEGRAIGRDPRWKNLMTRLRQQYDRAKVRAESGTASDSNFYDQAYRRVEKARGQLPMSDAVALEEFGAYAIEHYETAPVGVKSWVDAILGVIKDFLSRRLGIQLGEVTPAQLRALAVSALRASARTSEVRAENTLLASLGDEIRALPDATALEDATKALDEPEQYKPDFIGQLQQDIGRIAKFILHPRQIAALHKDFAPVYQTAVNQFEMRDSIIDELQQDHKAYDVLPPKSKERVNAVLELGRLLSATYGEKQLRAGIANPGQKSVVKFTEGGSSYRAKEKLNALLSAEGEVIQLDDAEIEAYLGLREMFDAALEKFKDQTLVDFGFPELAGQKNATKAIMDMIDPTTPAAKKERLEGIARFIQEIEQAKRTGYVPFARYGDYVVAVKEQQFPLKLIHDPDSGGWITRDLPSQYEQFLDSIGAEFDQLEGGYRLDRTQRQALVKENERTIHSAKVEFTLKDKALIKAGKPVEELPSVKAALAEAEKWKDGNPNRRTVAFETIQKKPEGGMKLSDVDALAEVAMLDTDTWDAVRDQLADAIKGRSFRKHFFQADNVPGYTADFERAIADYMAGMAGYLSRRHYNRTWDDAVAAIKAPRLFDYASKYRAYANEPQEELAMLRQVGFFQYIAGVPATAFVNLTQPFLMTVPALSQIAPLPMVVKEMGRAYKDALAMIRASKRVGLDFFDPTKAPADIRNDLLKAWGEGMFVPLQTYEVMATARNRNVGSRQVAKNFNKLIQVTASLFSFAERLNRLVTFIAAARLAGKPGVQQRARQAYRNNALAKQTMLKDWSPSSLADFMIDETQFRMGKANRPTIMRGLGAVIMQFKGFVMQSLESWYRWAAQNGKQGAKAVALSLGAMVLIGGLWGLPGADDLRDLIEKAYKQVTHQDLDLKTELRRELYEVTGERWLSEVASKGATYPFGLDLSRVGMGNVAPDSPLQVFGIPADLFIGRPSRAFQKGSQGDFYGAAGEFLPNFLKNPVTAYGWSQNGVRDNAGRLILDESQVGAEEQSLKSLGFQPSRITDIRDYEYAQRRMETANDMLKRDYASKLVKLIAKMEKNPEKAADAQAEMDGVLAEIEAHNAKATGPEEMIIITRSTLKQRLQREMGGIEQTWGRERKQARGASQNLREVFGLSEEQP